MVTNKYMYQSECTSIDFPWTTSELNIDTQVARLILLTKQLATE